MELLQRPVGKRIFCRPILMIGLCLSDKHPGLDTMVQEVRRETQDIDSYLTIEELENIQAIVRENELKFKK